MFRKIIASVVILAVVTAVPAMFSGCGPKEYTIEKHTTECNKPVSSDTVVE